ncbi:MAG: aspartyl-tRNA(Asn)/glutamyl-tRNA(Gln) amidotransferase subunit [Thermotogaceae bacterium]|nr:aspartyl-tRNA(Asn)/glutamyl-tRNA(Gln) amidotransferase subunit [Thermotogaceae bacterium]
MIEDKYGITIGLEIHAQLLTSTKIFCSCDANVFDKEPNSSICPVCTGQPGALPVLNEEVVRKAVMAALALNCKINRYSRFDRKNYFYPDLPKGYQITQYFYPIAENGYLNIKIGEGNKKIRIRRLHIEEDAGKMLHSSDNITQATHSLVDLNRCGIPLIEIVTEPDIESPIEARLFMEKLRDILRYIDVCTGDMEKGALRCDANISIYNKETLERSSRVEVKNINSFRFVEKALDFEADRIKKMMEKGERVEQETRGWDFSSRSTVSMRSKEEESDYRYFPEPDLPPLIVSEDYINELKEKLPELPDEKIQRFQSEYNLLEYDATVLSSSKKLADFFEDCVRLYNNPKRLSNIIINDLLSLLNEHNVEIDGTKIRPEAIVKIAKLIDSSKISASNAKSILEETFKTGKDPQDIVKEKGLEQIDDEEFLNKIIEKVIQQNSKAVEDYRKGKKGVVGFLVGMVMRETRGKANPKVVSQMIESKLNES